MTKLLRNKNLATKFQILVEIARSQPDIHQNAIARNVSITPQATSQYIMHLQKDNWIISSGRSKYRVTREGMNWLLKSLKETQGYFNQVEKVTHNESVRTAIANCQILKGQKIGLTMREGLLVATPVINECATGIAASNADTGDDIGVFNIEGIIEPEAGKISILGVPDIWNGGSRRVNLTLLRRETQGQDFICAIGIESLIALKRVGITPKYIHGVSGIIIEAAQRGISSVVACVNSELTFLIQRLEEKKLEYALQELNRLTPPVIPDFSSTDVVTDKQA
jgi:putative transcriptional regulator